MTDDHKARLAELARKQRDEDNRRQPSRGEKETSLPEVSRSGEH